MLRVGLTGELASGKSTVARLLAEHGAIVLSSDEMARAMMQPGHPVYQAILDRFGPEVVLDDGQLNRPALARLAFDPERSRIEELNAIVHPAVLTEQECQVIDIARTHPEAIVVIESALIFTTKHAGNQPWRKRFDLIILVTAPDELKLERFAERVASTRPSDAAPRTALKADALSRLQAQRIASDALGDLRIENNSGMDVLRRTVDSVWRELQARNHQTQNSELNGILGKRAVQS